jgi:predicted dehydrogenase
MSSISVGIIGVGNIGSAHLQCIYNNEISGMYVSAVCDIDRQKLGFIEQKYPGVRLYRNADELLSDGRIDAVIIAVPHPFHANIAAEAFARGKHVLVEKPVDISVSAAEKLNVAAKKSGRVFGIMFNQRTNRLFQTARRIIKSGELGELKRSVWIITNWYRTQRYYDSGGWRATWSGEGGGVLINQAPHQLDLWQWICGMPESVTAFCNTAKYHNIEVEDEATIYTTYKNGATGVFITSTGDYPGTNRLEISGTLGKLVLEDGVLKHRRLKQNERKVCASSDESFCRIESEYSEYRESEEGAHKEILQNFADAVLYGAELLAPGYEGINELMISNAAYLSEWQGNTRVKLPFDPAEFDTLLKEKASASKYRTEDSIEWPEEGYLPRWQVRW